MWKKLTNTDIDIDGGKDRKAHSSFYVLLEQLLRLIWKLRVLESYLGTSWHKVTVRVASTPKEARAKKEGVLTDFNNRSYPSESEEVFLIKWMVCYYLHSSWERQSDMDRFDPMGITSKSKVWRYVQAQEAPFGLK